MALYACVTPLWEQVRTLLYIALMYMQLCDCGIDLRNIRSWWQET